MAQSKNSFLSALASSVTSSGTVPSAALAPEVTSSIEGAGTAVYDSASLLPIVGNTAGDTAFVKSTSRLYIHSGLGWYNVAVINNTPTVQSITDSGGGTTPFALATDGTPTTITITAQDSDGDPLTYNYSADSNFGGLATLSQDANVFTITPFSQDSASTTSGTITFTVTDGINTAIPGIQTFTLNFLSPYWDEAVLSIGTSSTNSLANSAFIDRSTNAHTVTPTGSPVQTAFHPYLDDWSVEFDGGTSTRLTLPSDTSFAFGTGAYTVEAWIYISASTTGAIIFDSGAANGSFSFLEEGGQLKLSKYGTGAQITSSAGAIETNKWHHCAVVRSSTSTNDTKLYVDGVLVGTGTDSNNWSTTTTPSVGGVGLANYTINGFISNLRVVKGSAVYTSAFTPSTSALEEISGTSLLTCQSNRFIENSTSAHTLTVAGNLAISAYNPFGQLSEYAVGENKGSMTTNDDTNKFISFDRPAIGASDDIALSFWVYITDDAYENWYTDTDATRFLIYGDANGTELELYISSTTVITTTGLTKMEWHHVEVNRASGIWYLHVDGEYRDSTTTHGTTSFNVSTQYIAYNSGSGTNTIKGYISDYYFSIGNALHTSISNFTPPTAPVGNTNASLYLPMDNAGIFDKTGNNTLTLAGNTSTLTTQTKFGDTAMYFDGSGDYISTETTPSIDIQTGDFTVECWAYPLTKTNTVDSVFGYGDFKIMLYHDNTNWSAEIGNGSSVTFTLSGSVTLNSWQHLALVRSGNTFTLYIDGTSAGSNTTTTVGALEDLTIGLNDIGSPQWFTGYIENFQILKGVAKYTANFTPPTQTQGRTYQAES